MQIDELRGELTTLADEIEPFEGDVGSLHRRERRRRIVRSSLVVALTVVVGASTIAVARHRDDGRVRVTSAGSKEVPSIQIAHVDVIVVPATPAVQDVLDASSVVRRYARVARSVRASSTSLGPASPLRAPFCALESSDGFAVEATTGGSDIRQILARDLAGRATAYDVSDSLGYDLRVFLKPAASSTQIESLRAALASDRDISWIRFMSQADAYEQFKKDFADQPALVESTKPSDLPVSFTIDLEPGSSVQTTSERYKKLGIVDSVLAGLPTSLFKPTFLLSPTDRTASACTKP
jgi:FtsX extracellular domain